jgi:hypothetical protein
MANGADEPPNPVTSVAVRIVNGQNSTNPTQEIQASPHGDTQAHETATLAIDSALTSIANPDSVLTSVNADPAQTASLAPSGPALNFAGFIQVQQPTGGPNISDSGASSGDLADQSMDSVLQPTGHATVSDSDVIMADDTDLPMYLSKMIGYLRGVAADREWQDLVTNFIAFEKTGRPVNGVSTMSLSSEHELTCFYDDQHLSNQSRPREVSDWIRSKKKDIVPFINSSAYGLRFAEWWGGMQPAWRHFQGADGPLNLVHDTPTDETWNGLRKGGTAGIYVVVMGLSWWIRAQRNQRDANAWAAVNDLSWVIQQMSNASDTISLALQKRRCEDESKDEGAEEQPKEKRGYVLSRIVVLLIDECHSIAVLDFPYIINHLYAYLLIV